MNSSFLVEKVWNFCHTLRDDGVGYGDYLEQLTCLLFLKLAHEYAQKFGLPPMPATSTISRLPTSSDFYELRRFWISMDCCFSRFAFGAAN